MDEFRGLVEEQYYDWVAQYLVMKRASIEPNFHNLYMSFLNSLSSSFLRKSVLSETFRNIKVIINTVLHCSTLHTYHNNPFLVVRQTNGITFHCHTHVWY